MKTIKWSMHIDLIVIFIYQYLYCIPAVISIYEGHLESSLHDIIAPQCVYKMLSNKIFFETRIQQLLDGLIFVKKGLGVHVQRMVKLSCGLYTGGTFKQNIPKKLTEI